MISNCQFPRNPPPPAPPGISQAVYFVGSSWSVVSNCHFRENVQAVQLDTNSLNNRVRNNFYHLPAWNVDHGQFNAVGESFGFTTIAQAPGGNVPSFDVPVDVSSCALGSVPVGVVVCLANAAANVVAQYNYQLTLSNWQTYPNTVYITLLMQGGTFPQGTAYRAIILVNPQAPE
jgi:hypothetical protein